MRINKRPEGSKQPRETVEFQGKSYHRYPESPHLHLRKYYWTHSSNTEPPTSLSVAVWVHHNGPIPADHHVHHKDRNTLNNDPSNLECIPREQHEAEHSEERSLRASSPKHLEHLAAIRQARPRATYTCVECGKSYEAFVQGRNKFCSPNCQSLSNGRIYRDNNREVVNERARQWRAANKEKSREAVRQYRLRKKARLQSGGGGDA